MTETWSDCASQDEAPHLNSHLWTGRDDQLAAGSRVSRIRSAARQENSVARQRKMLKKLEVKRYGHAGLHRGPWRWEWRAVLAKPFG